MSVGFNAKNEQTLNRQLKVQELAVSGLDYELYSYVAGSGAPDAYIGVAGTYGLLANTAITNTGSSVINGNVGLTPGSSISGFPPGVIIGTLNVDNAAAVAAQSAANSGYTALNALSATTISGVLDGQTLTPGNYKVSSSASLAGSGNATLTLNGAGNYVFQIPSTLTTGAGGTPTILLTGGATAAKIYWVVGSSATINVSGSGVFQGNIIANTSITLDGGSANGSMLALNGALTISAATIVTAVSTGSSTINLTIYVREPVAKVVNAYDKIDSSNTVYPLNYASISIVDTNGGLSGYNEFGTAVSDQGAILLSGIPGTTFAPNDCAVVKYIVANHL